MDVIKYCVYEVKTENSNKLVKITGALFMFVEGRVQQPSFMLVNVIENQGQGVPIYSIFLVPLDPDIYFMYMDQDDQLPGSTAESRGVNLTKQGITGLHIEKYATNIFVTNLEGER